MTNGYTTSPKGKKLDHNPPRVQLIYLENYLELTDNVDRHLLVVIISGRYRLEKSRQTVWVKSGYMAVFTLKASQQLVLEGEEKEKCHGIICSVDFAFIKKLYDQYEGLFDNRARSTQKGTNDFLLLPMSPLLQAEMGPLKYHVHKQVGVYQSVVELNVGAVIAAIVLESDLYRDYFSDLCRIILNDLPVRLKTLLLEYVNSDAPIHKIAAKGGYSTTAFNKIVREYLGLSPRQWINQARLEMSMNLLKNKKNSVAYVCQEVGFESQSYFSVIFKKQFGMTPKKYQKSLNEKKSCSFEIV